jgi:cell cycle sensor histidine kinase DivJ
MIAGETKPRASEFGSPVVMAKMKSWFGGRTARAAGVSLACAMGVCVAVTAAAAPAKVTSSASLAAAFGLAFAARRPRNLPGPRHRGDMLLALAGDFLARQRIDGRVTAIEGEGWTEWAADSAELVGYGLLDRMCEDDRELFLAQLSAVAADGRSRMATFRLAKAGAPGGFEPVEARSCRGLSDGGLVSAFRRNRAQAELEAAREEARIERTLKDRLLANMSHELRTPLNAILGFSEILGHPEMAPTDPQKRLEYARIIHTSAEHLLSVVNLVLDMSRIEAGKFAVTPEPLELAPLIRECCDMLRLRASTGKVEIVAAPLAEGFEIVADKAACRQILVNLLSNAIKFTPPNGRVTVEASVEADVARISVTDNGIGVKPDDLPRLGDPFFQVRSGYDRSYEGAGLGLSLVRGLVGLHDGSLVLESAYGVGTRVTAALPMTAKPANRRAPARLETIPKLTLPPLAATSQTQEERRIA